VKRFFLLGLVLLAGACGEDETPPVEPSAIIYLGRVERSAVVGRRVVIDGDTVPDSLITWFATDPSRITLLDSARIRFDSAGNLTLKAVVGSDTFSRARAIPKPPVVVFDQVSDSGNRDIWRVDLDGRSLQRLTTDVADDRDPVVRGNEVLFISFRGGVADVWRASLNGGGDTRVTNTATQEADLASSKDGARLAFTHLVGGLPKLYRANSGGGSLTAVTSSFSDGAVDAAPSFAPSSDKLVFVSSQGGPVRLWTADLGSGDLDTLPRGAAGADVEPAWSPDGGSIAFASNRDGPTELYVLRLSTGVTTRLTLEGGSNGRANWTADGRILYVNFVSGVPSLRWLDPAFPGVVHEIPVGPKADHPSSTW
jgi:Tol biopolymer transport system component